MYFEFNLLVLHVLGELFLALSVRARIPRIPCVILDQLLNLFEGRVEGDGLALVQHPAEVVFLFSHEGVDVLVEQTLAL